MLPELSSGSLAQVLEDWRYSFGAYCLYYPDQRRGSPAFSLLLEALRGGLPVSANYAFALRIFSIFMLLSQGISMENYHPPFL